MDVFHKACEKSGGERVALLDSVSSDDPSLRLVLEQMLRDHEAGGSFLNDSPLQCLTPGKIPPSAAAAGKKFGRYEVIAPIGRGGMGEVWVAQDTELDRRVALKFLHHEVVGGRAVERLRREARTVSALNHPNIVTVHEVIAHEEAAIIVMELVDGNSLRELCGTPQPVDDLIHIGLQIARALAAAHAHGIIHRDIKPENILLRRDGYLKVLDFGLARHVAADTLRFSGNDLQGGGTLPAGTLRYMSPEQARGESLSPASDVFSFGLVLYELAAGRHAFPRDSAGEAMQAILIEQAIAPSFVNSRMPPGLDSLILSMLAADPGARPSAEDVARTLKNLEALATSSSLSALASADRIRSARWGKWITAGRFLRLAVLLLAGGILAWLWRHHGAIEKQPAFRQITTLVPENRATAAAISPDGKQAAYANADGIFVRSMQNGDTRTLPAPADYVVDRLAWFADNGRLVASGFSRETYIPSVWLISANGAPRRLLRTNARVASPSPDGTHIVFVTADKSQIWVMETNGKQARCVVAGLADGVQFIFWSPDGRRLTFKPRRRSSSYKPNSYESVALATGKVVAIAGDSWMSSASALPDGRVMFLRWDTLNFTSSSQLWEVKTDSATGAFVGKPRKIADVIGDGTTLLDLSVTADGKQAMVLKRSDQNTIFVGDFDQSSPSISNIRRLTLEERTNNPHAWTADSREVIFESDRSGNYDLFKQAIDRRTPDTLIATPLTEILPQLTPDGRFVLYAARPPESERHWYYKPRTYKLMRVEVNGGVAAEVPIGGALDEFRCALGPGRRCVLRAPLSAGYRAYYDLDPIKGKGRELARTKLSMTILGDWDISPDGTHVAIPNHDPREARIKVVALEPGPNDLRERDVVLPGLASLRGLVWAADGSGWFVSVDTTVGNRMLYVYLDGRYRSLGDIQGWAVPSPDGRRVAFLDRVTATNAWVIDRR